MPFLQDIQNTYGIECTNQLRNISTTYRKIANQKNRRIFLLRCKHTNVFPKFLNFKVTHIRFLSGTYLENKFGNIIYNTKVNTLNLLITDTIKTLKSLELKFKEIVNKTKTMLPENVFNEFMQFENRKYEKTFQYIKQKNQKKLSNLISHTQPKEININTQTWLNNISDTDIPQDISEILALGANFSLPITNEKHLPINEYISSIESAIYDKAEDVKDSIRSTVVNIITNHKIKTRHKKNNNNKFQSKIQKNMNKTKQFIKDNPQITILKPDKSNKTVIMNTSDYDNKINELLSDKTIYKKLKTDPTKSFQIKNNALIKKLLTNKKLTETEAKKLTIHNAVTPKIYGLPKLHKPNIPLRPITSSVQSPFYNLSKYLSNCLSKITGKNDFYIRDSFTFKKFLDTIQIPLNYKLVSLDVVSLYTNIPNNLISKILKEKWNKIKEHTTLNLQEFTECMNLVLNNNYFQFKDNFFQQIDGCAMGLPISSTIAQVVMEYLEESVMEKLNFNILFFKRYVDDCLAAVPEDKINLLLQAFNNFHVKLQFTTEIENNNNINFLDLTIYREKNNNLKTKWYTKETWSGRYLNFNSHHSKNQKNSVIIGLVDRAITLTSPEFRPETLKKVEETLILNHFPKNLVRKIIKQRTHIFYNKGKNNNPETIPKNTYIALPYVNYLSEKIKYILTKYNIEVCHKAHNLLKPLYTKLKSKVPTKKKSNVIYSVPCLNCPKKYIGMTTQYLENRINGHKYTRNASTALHKHEQTANHEFDFKNTKILDTDKNYHKLIVKEMIHIKKEENALNDKKDIKNLSQMYHNLIFN